MLFLIATIFLSSTMYAKQVNHESYNPCFFNYSEFVSTSTIGIEMRNELVTMEEKFHKDAMQKEAALKELVEEYNSKKPMLSQAAKVSEENKLKSEEEQFRNMIRRMQQEMTAYAEELGKEMSALLEDELQVFAEKNGYDVIFDIATGRIVYCKEQLNKTADIVALVNEKTEKMKQEEAIAAQEKAKAEKTKIV
jgi:Skp family chaperone for outer membrane proteins